MFPLALMMVMDDDDRNYMITLYEQYQWLMLAVARKYVQTKYDQEEVISEACKALIKNISTLRTLKGKKLPAYIVTTVKNKARDYLNRQNTLRNRPVPIDGVSYNLSDDDSDVECQILLSEEIALIIRSINALPTKEKQVFLLKYKYDMDTDTIAKRVGISKESVSKYFCRAKRKIKAAVYGGKVNP